MKKLLSLTLAVAMVMSMASVAFAATKTATLEIGTSPYAEDSNATKGQVWDKVGYGDMVLYPISSTAEGATGLVEHMFDTDADFTDYEMAKKLKTKATWESTPELVKGVSIAKKKIAYNGSFGYFVVVETSPATTTDRQDVIGSIKLSGSNITFGTSKAKEVTLPVAFALGYDYAVPEIASGRDTSVTLTDTSKYIFNFGTNRDEPDASGPSEDELRNRAMNSSTANRYETYSPEDEEFEINLYGDVGRFVVNTFGQGKVLVGNSVKYNEGFETKIPDNNYVYVNGNGAMFNKIGTLYLKAAPTDVPYQSVNDKLVKLNATYDDVEEAFVIRTRTIGKYVIAEKELDLEAANAADPVEGEVPEVAAKENPTTGAAC